MSINKPATPRHYNEILEDSFVGGILAGLLGFGLIFFPGMVAGFIIGSPLLVGGAFFLGGIVFVMIFNRSLRFGLKDTTDAIHRHFERS